MAIVAIGLAAWIRAGTRTKQPELEIVRPNLRRVDTTITATGIVRVTDGHEVRVGSRVSGTVRRLHVGIGTRVRRGELIAEIDPTEMRARFEEARAATEVDAVDHRRAVLALHRAERLAAAGIVPDSQLDELRAAADAAKARAERDRREAEVMKSQLDAAQIFAPIDGTVSSVSTEQGETVAASFASPTFITITDRSAIEIAALVDEHDIGGVRPGLPVTFEVEAYPSREYSGRVKRIAPKGTIVSGVVNYEVVVDPIGPIDGLAIDMTATVTIQTGSRTALLIPAGVLRREGDSVFVLLRKQRGLERRAVTVGDRFGGEVEVRGLRPDDRVAADIVRRGT